MDRDGIVAAIRRAAEEMGGVAAMSRSRFTDHTGISQRQVLAHFEGWTAAVTAAGLQSGRSPLLPEDELFRTMRAAFEEMDGNITITAFARHSRHDPEIYRRRFGGWRQVLAAFRRWLERTGEPFRFVDRLPSDDGGSEAGTTRPLPERPAPGLPLRPRGARAPKLGPILNYRQMLHAPVNEQGVVLLFGMLAGELGFVVEAVQVGYPDCEAKRQVGKRREGWERIRIEFEYRSSSFRDAGHDPAGCDLVVCWAHDWEACPLEVLELRRVVGA